MVAFVVIALLLSDVYNSCAYLIFAGLGKKDDEDE
jgi:hypothetical protein